LHLEYLHILCEYLCANRIFGTLTLYQSIKTYINISMKNIFLFGLILSVFASCNNKTDEVIVENYDKTLSLNYYIRADKSNFVTGEVYAFNEGDTVLPNIESATLQGAEMLKSRLSNDNIIRMRIDKEFPKTNSYDFVVNHARYQPIKATLEISPIKNFNIKEGVLSISNGFSVNWDGPRIGSQNETMIIVITDSKGQSASLNRIGETATSGFSVAPIQLQYYNFAKGKATISLVRKAVVDYPSTSYYKQKAEIEYYTDELTIDIVE